MSLENAILKGIKNMPSEESHDEQSLVSLIKPHVEDYIRERTYAFAVDQSLAVQCIAFKLSHELVGRP
jgi:hypothetical protein